MRCYPPATLQKTRSWAGGLQDGLSSRPHGAVLQRKQQMSDLWVWLQPNRLFLPRELWQVKRRNLHGLAFVHGGRGRCAPWCMAESGAVIYLLTKDCIKNKSWKVTSWMPCTCWAEGQGSCSFSVYEHRPLAQEMLNIKGHSLNCPTYLAGLAGRGLTPGCEDNMKAKEGSLLATCRFIPSPFVEQSGGLLLATFDWLPPGWDSVSHDRLHQHIHQLLRLAFPLLDPALRTSLQKDLARGWFCPAATKGLKSRHVTFLPMSQHIHLHALC